MRSEESVETKNAKGKVAAAKDKVILKIRQASVGASAYM